MAGIAPGSSPFPNFNLRHGNDEMDVDEADESGQQLLDLEKGFSDDDSTGDLFADISASLEAHKTLKAKKTPRRLSDPIDGGGDAPEVSPTKKVKFTSLFGGPSRGVDDTDETPPQTPGTAIGMRMSSLDLNQQESDHDEDEELTRPDIDLSAKLGLTEPEDVGRLSPDLSFEDGSRDPGDFTSHAADPVESYGLRKNRKNISSTHLDHDQSGNYDPAADAARQKSLKMALAKKAKQAQQAKKENAEAKKRKGKGKAVKSPEDIKEKRIVSLKIRAMGSVLNITDGQDNWPDQHSVIDSEDEAERKELFSFYRERSPGPPPPPHIPILDPTHEVTDIAHHPAARGCKECCVNETACSMVVDGQYPCTDCQDTNTECNPIVKPAFTRPCERCEGLGKACSFAEKSGNPQDGMCDECLKADNHLCEPRRPLQYKTNRIDLDLEMYSKNRKHAACTHCRENNKRCSVRNSGKPPCKQCQKARIGCHFYDIAPRDKGKSAVENKKRDDAEEAEEVEGEDPAKAERSLMEKIAPEFSIPGTNLFTAEDMAYLDEDNSAAEDQLTDEEPAETEAQELMEDAEGHRGYLTKIKTCFAHPMVFSVGDAGPFGSVQDCDFCGIPIFGFVGHWEREVAVMEWTNGLGYTEFGNGHRDTGQPTTMCQACTFHRLQIISCPGHDLQELHIGEQADFAATADDLMAAQPGTFEVQQQLQRWCSLCFSPASYQCYVEQPPINETEGESITMDGCGLRLCEACALKLDNVYKYDFDAMVTDLDKEPKPKEADEDEDAHREEREEGTVRADVGLLRVEGLLTKCVYAMGE